MKIIYKIARTELRNLFYSPIAWFLIIAFLVQCAMSYAAQLQYVASIQEMGGQNQQHLPGWTYMIFNSQIGLFSNAMRNLYLYIPLLTMGLISREINGGTFSLLYSSPVKVREIVFGKFLAMMIYSLVLVAVMAVFMISGVFHIRSADTGILWSGVLGFYLLLCAYSAIGLFMSSLTSYQVVAAIGTFIVIGILSYIGGLWQGIDFVRDLTYFLSLNGRTEHMLSGLLTTRDILYFIIVVYIFVGLTIYKLKSARESKPLSVKITRYTIVIVSALSIGYVSSRPALIGYWDVTVNKNNTLTPNAQQIIGELVDSTLEVTVYSNFLDNFYRFGMPEQRNEYLARWEPYIRFKPDIRFHFVNYYDTAFANGYDMFKAYNGKTLQQIVEQRAKSLDIDMALFRAPAEVHKQIDLRPEGNRFVMQLKYKGRTTFLRVFNDQELWPSETEVAAAFKRLLQARMPKVAIATGSGERSMVKKGERSYEGLTVARTFRYALINQGFDVDTVSLDTREIPDSIIALVVADPLHELSPAAVQKIEQYIARGGNLLIAGEPGRQELLNPLLSHLGVQLMDGMLEQKSDDYSPALVLPQITKTAIGYSKMLSALSIDTMLVSANGVAGLQYSDTAGFKVAPLLQTLAGRASNTMARNPDLDLVGVTPSGGKPDAAAGAIKQERVYTTALALTRQLNGREQRIVISGDADLMSNAELQREGPFVLNFNFVTSLFSWMDNGQFPIVTTRPDAKDTRVMLTKKEVSVLRIIYVWVLPAVVLLFGSVLLIRRKRK